MGQEQYLHKWSKQVNKKIYFLKSGKAQEMHLTNFIASSS